MNYFEWAKEYVDEADKVLGVIEKKKRMMKEAGLSRDDKKTLLDTVIAYRCIYRDLLRTASMLRERAGEKTDAA